MKTFDVIIQGISPLLQSKFAEDAEQPKATRSVLQDRGTPREQAEKAVLRQGNRFYFPGTWIAGTIREAASNHKLRGSRRSAKFVVPSAVRVLDVDITLCDVTLKPLKDFEVDSRPVVIPATKGRVMRHRPRFDEWSAKFSIEIDDNILPDDFVQQLLTEAGRGQGVGDFRPNKMGPFGRFMVVSWTATL